MSSARSKSLKALKQLIEKSSSRIVNIAKGQGEAGHRAAPAKTTKNDSKVGSRLDFGATFQKDGKTFRRYNWQLNKDAEDSTLKKLAAKNSHKVWSYADIEVDPNANEENSSEKVDDIFTQLEENMEE